MELPSKECHACGKPVKGRSDKKFCDDYCRNVYNNQVKSDGYSQVRNITNALKKNRQILASVILPAQETRKISRAELIDLGFKFKWMTHRYTTNAGNTYIFCYDYGYLQLDKERCLVVKDNITSGAT